MATGILYPNLLYNTGGNSAITVGGNNYTGYFAPDHPARTALDASPDSYWHTQNGHQGNYGGGTLFAVAPSNCDITQPVTLRFYATHVESIGETPTDYFALRMFFEDGTNTYRDVPLTPTSSGTWAGETTGILWPGDTPPVTDLGYQPTRYDHFLNVASPPEPGQLVRLRLFHVEIEYTATSGGLWPLRQRQSLIGNGSWPVRQRQNGGHSGSWALRQRQTRT